LTITVYLSGEFSDAVHTISEGTWKSRFKASRPDPGFKYNSLNLNNKICFSETDLRLFGIF
jgi:hypothetical protein